MCKITIVSFVSYPAASVQRLPKLGLSTIVDSDSDDDVDADESIDN